VPFFVTERKRSEMALASLVQEAFINCVSTPRIERLAQALGVENISASQVSEINKGLGNQVELFRSRPLEEEYPFIMIDAHYDKVRVEENRSGFNRTRKALGAAALLAQEYGDRFPDALRCLKEGLEDWLQFYSFPEIDPKKISSTNMSERSIREVRRRSRVIGIFPTIDSWVRLETCYLMGYSED